eukprot:TRINITY_DN26020_c0_g1_i1.p1 TRINITY_DN26020_c0_g1~~TRINITY_DN26020_c0_g1_i1.p1  ORF type:complete len:1011 (+),score=158.42 TRINITY_DN26020_c0_g1_i1:300-3035(+)
MVKKSEGQAAAAGVEEGSQILAINEHPVDDMQTVDIQGMLDREHLPITLDLKPPLNLPTVKRRKKRSKDPVTVNTTNCRGSYRVVSEACERLGWLEISDNNKAASVVWVEHGDPTDAFAPVQTVSRIDAFLHFCQKARLAQGLNMWVDELPQAFAFAPRTWVLPWDIEELKEAMRKVKETYICKPTGGAQGKGIILARKWKDLDNVATKCKAVLDAGTKRTPLEYVVQRYVSQPLLIDGLKFDMRLYVIVTSIVPMRAYIFKEGLARFCTIPYQAPKEGNLRDARMHLTNFAVNKNSKSFQVTESLAQHDEGSKRSVSSVLRQIELLFGVPPPEMWKKVAQLVANTLMALRPGLLEWYVHEKARPLHPLGPKSFQIVGLDVLLDGTLEPRLLEINANSSLSVTQPGASAESEAESIPNAPHGDGIAGDSESESVPPPEGLPAAAQTAPGGASPAATAVQAAAPAAAALSPAAPGPSSASAPAPAQAALQTLVMPSASAPALINVAQTPMRASVCKTQSEGRTVSGPRSSIHMSTMELKGAMARNSTFGAAGNSGQGTDAMARTSTSLDPGVKRRTNTGGGSKRPGSAGGHAWRTTGGNGSPGTRKTSASPGRGGRTVGGNRQLSRPRLGLSGTRKSALRSSASVASSTTAASGASHGNASAASSHAVVSSRAEKKRTSGDEHTTTCLTTSELDLEIKRNLISHAFMLSKPAPQNKTVRLKRLWDTDGRVEDFVPLDDSGKWALSGKQPKAAAVRSDAPDRCPALEIVDFASLAEPQVVRYARAHLALYRMWTRNCGQGRDSLGQPQMLRLMERLNLVGQGALFSDRIAAQLWLSRMWREVASGAYGLNLPQFVGLVGRLGRMILGISEAEGEVDPQTQRSGMLEIASRAGLDGPAGDRGLPPIAPHGGTRR